METPHTPSNKTENLTPEEIATRARATLAAADRALAQYSDAATERLNTGVVVDKNGVVLTPKEVVEQRQR